MRESGIRLPQPYNHDFVRVAVAIPAVRVADPAFNGDQTLALMRKAMDRKASSSLFPELGLSAYTCDDLFHQRALLDGCRDALANILAASARMADRRRGRDAARSRPSAVQLRGDHQSRTHSRRGAENLSAQLSRILRAAAVSPGRQCAPHRDRTLRAKPRFHSAAGCSFKPSDIPALTLPRRDLRGPVGADSAVVARGAGRRDRAAQSFGLQYHRRQGRLSPRSGREPIGAMPRGVSLFGGRPRRIDHRSRVGWARADLRERQPARRVRRFHSGPQLICAEIDLERLAQERMRQNSFGDSMRNERARLTDFRTVTFLAAAAACRAPAARASATSAFPMCPSDPARRDERCAEVYEIQVQGLASRLARDRASSASCIGISGGLDSTHALLVCAQAMDRLRLSAPQHPRLHDAGICDQRAHAGAGAPPDGGDRLRGARDGHPSERAADAQGHRPSVCRGARAVYDITFENVQAGERTSHLFRLANLNDALVVGTGDLSELALGWCTYGVGDHMSHYAVNASVPKTLIQHVIRWVAETHRFGRGGERDAARDPRDADQPRAGARRATASRSRIPRRSSVPTNCRTSISTTLCGSVIRRPRSPSSPSLRGTIAMRGAWPDIPDEQRNQYDSRADQKASANLPLSLFQAEPVQAQLHSECAQGRLGRIAVAARRLSRTQRWRVRGLAGAARSHSGRRRVGGSPPPSTLALSTAHEAPLRVRDLDRVSWRRASAAADSNRLRRWRVAC